MGCIERSKEAKDTFTRLMQVGKKWEDSPLVRNYFRNDGGHKEFARLYETALGRNMSDKSRPPNMREVGQLSRHIDRQIALQDGRSLNKFVSNFYLTQEVMKRNPASQKYYNEIIEATAEFKGSTDKDMNTLVDIDIALRKSAGTFSKVGAAIPGYKGRSKITKSMEQLNTEYKVLAQAEPARALREYQQGEQELLSTGEGAALKQLYELINNKALLKSDKYDSGLKTAAEKWYIQRDVLFKDLKQGLNIYKNMMVDIQKKMKGNEDINNLVHVLTRLHENLKPEDNYYPGEILKIMPTMQYLAQDLNSNFHTGLGEMKNRDGKHIDMDIKIQEMNKYVTAFVEKNPMVLRHLMEKSGTEELQSKNVMNVLDQYSRSVSRFKYMAKVNSSFMRGIRQLWDVGNKGDNDGMGEGARGMADYMIDMHQALMGSQGVNMTPLKHMIRSATALEFMSKLGLNFRSALRNSTQSVQNYTYFGYSGIKETAKILKHETSTELRARLKKSMEDNGVFFAEIEEVAYGKELAPQYRLDTDGQVIQSENTMGGRISEFLNKGAKKSGFAMQKAENINRHLTFKLAFVKDWDARLKSGEARRYALKLLKKKGEQYSEADKQKLEYDYLEKKATTFANGIVRKIHFEYGQFAKAKVLRTGFGNLVGQFQHYGMNFLSYQYQIGKKGLQSVRNRNFGTEEAWMMYRLGILNLMITGILTPLLRVDVGNLIQNDTAEKAMNIYNLITAGDEPEKNKYGVGLTGPFLGDMVSLGNFTGLIEMDDEAKLAYLTGYKNFAEMTDDEKTESALRNLSPAISRWYLDHTPKYANGTDIISLAANEAGLYRSRKFKKTKPYKTTPLRGKSSDSRFTPGKVVSPQGLTKEDMLAYLQQLERR